MTVLAVAPIDGDAAALAAELELPILDLPCILTGSAALKRAVEALRDAVVCLGAFGGYVMLTLSADAANERALKLRESVMRLGMRFQTAVSRLSRYLGAAQELDAALTDDPLLAEHGFVLRELREQAATPQAQAPAPAAPQAPAEVASREQAPAPAPEAPAGAEALKRQGRPALPAAFPDEPEGWPDDLTWSPFTQRRVGRSRPRVWPGW